MALAFVPQASVVDEFEELQDFADAEMGPILNYFEDNYIGRKRRRNLASPMYAHGLWNIEEMLVDGLPCTNNAVKAGNATCNQPLPVNTRICGNFFRS